MRIPTGISRNFDDFLDGSYLDKFDTVTYDLKSYFDTEQEYYRKDERNGIRDGIAADQECPAEKKCALKECIKYESWKDDEKIKRIVGDRDVTDADSKYSNRGLSDAVIRQ